MTDRGIRYLRWIVLAFICVWSLFPIYWALNTSFMTNLQAQAVPANYFPHPFNFNNYTSLISRSDLWPDFSQSMLNTVIECGVSTILTIIIAVFSAYAFARMQFRFKNLIFYAVLATLSLPSYTTLIPLYQIMSNVQLVNTYLGVILVYVSGFLPLALWVLYNYFSAIPEELEEAAAVDGASTLRTVFGIVMPLSMPGIASAAIITFLTAWGQFLFPLVLTTDSSTHPITVFMTGLLGRHSEPYTLLNAAGILSIIIPAIIVVCLNRFIIRGMLAGSIK